MQKSDSLPYLGMLIAIRDFLPIVFRSFLMRVRTSMLTHGNDRIFDFLSIYNNDIKEMIGIRGIFFTQVQIFTFQIFL